MGGVHKQTDGTIVEKLVRGHHKSSKWHLENHLTMLSARSGYVKAASGTRVIAAPCSSGLKVANVVFSRFQTCMWSCVIFNDGRVAATYYVESSAALPPADGWSFPARATAAMVAAMSPAPTVRVVS